MRHFDFGRPVLDFTVGDDGVIVVSLDGQWDEPDVIGNRLMVRTVKECSGEVPIRWLIVHGDRWADHLYLQLIETFDTYRLLVETLNFKGLVPGTSLVVYKAWVVTKDYSEQRGTEKTRCIR